MITRSFLIFAFSISLYSCIPKNISKKHAHQKFSTKELQQDFVVLKNILEKKHPSIYWYTSKDSMDLYFNQYYQGIKNDMSEKEFVWTILSPLINKIHCGHTSVSMSKRAEKNINKDTTHYFPFHLKIWNDTMAVTAFLTKDHPYIHRGTIIKSIDGFTTSEIKNKIFDCIPQDGYEQIASYLRVSFDFPYYYNNVFGSNKQYNIEYIDSLGKINRAIVNAFCVSNDSAKKEQPINALKDKSKRKANLRLNRSFTMDSTLEYATIILNTFSTGNLRHFFRQSFKKLNKYHIPNLIIDIRLNGGGRVNASTLLTKYISRINFKVADSVYAQSNTVRPFSKYFKSSLLNNIELKFIAKKKNDNYYHLSLFEKKIYQPKKKYHYEGKVFVLMGGPTFSASCLFVNAIKGQKDISLLGEQTGGGSYGNSGIVIPSLILPNTKIAVRMPFFKVIQHSHINEKGFGIVPDVYIGTSYEAIKNGYDKKMSVAKEMIISESKKH